MTPNDGRRAFRTDLWLAGLLIAAGVAIASLSLAEVDHRGSSVQLAQATPQPPTSTPGADSKPTAPEPSPNSGARPHEIAPQPARPDPDALDAGAKPALPPAPPEKVGEPIRPKG